jgi:hypothetical protein
MKNSMIAWCTLLAAILFFVIACQQSEKGKTHSKWQLAPAPSSAPGYGAPPVPPAVEEETTPSSTATLPVADGIPEHQPAAGGDGNQAPAPNIKVVPPPPAGGYGAQDPVQSLQKQTPPPSGGYGNQPLTPTWTIEPPPSAAGYGK